jgi:hypothetical protein
MRTSGHKFTFLEFCPSTLRLVNHPQATQDIITLWKVKQRFNPQYSFPSGGNVGPRLTRGPATLLRSHRSLLPTIVLQKTSQYARRHLNLD